MLGSTFILSVKDKLLQTNFISSFSSVKIKRESILSTEHASLFIDINVSYPYFSYKTEEITFIVEGIIYNFSEKEIVEKLQRIGGTMSRRENGFL